MDDSSLEQIKEQINRLDNHICKLQKTLDGNGNTEDGLIFRVQTMWNDYLLRKRTSMGYIDWAYRCFIGILITYVAIKLGIAN